MRRSRDVRASVAAKFWRIYNAKFLQHSYECRVSVARRSRDSLAKTSQLSGEKIKLSDIHRNVARHSHECRTNLNENKLHSRESRETLSRMSRDSRSTIATVDSRVRQKFADLSHKCLLNETAT